MSEKLDVHPVDRHVGERVRLIRKQRGVTQVRLANAMGLSFQQVQKYETGANRISASMLMAIAQTLETPITAFFEGLPLPADTVPSDAPDGVIAAILSSEQVKRLVARFVSLPVGLQPVVIDLVIAISEAGDQTKSAAHIALPCSESHQLR